jgi:hypothetical protein
MKSSFARLNSALAILAVGLPISLCAGPIPAHKPSAYPDWWFERDVIRRINPNNITPDYSVPGTYQTPDDYAVANQGQVKNLAKKAYDEFIENFPGGLDPALDLWQNPAQSTDDFRAVNLGQLKNVAFPFYTTLINLGLANDYPWIVNGVNGMVADDYALANAGQVKKLFGFTIPALSLHAPTNFVAAFDSGTGGVSLQWTDTNTSEVGYSIERRVATVVPETWSLVTQLPVNATSYNDHGLAEKTSYIYRVAAYNAAGSGTFAVSATVVTPPSVPMAPGQVGWVPVSGDQSVRLDWTDNSANETGFKIQRQVGTGAWQDLAQTAANVTSYTDSGLTATQAYQYRVAAINATVLSAWTAVYQVWAVPSVPTGLQNVFVNSDSAKISWVSGTGAGTLSDQIRRYRSTTLETSIGVGAGTNTYLDAGLQASTTYRYAVVSRNERGSSAEASITVTTSALQPTVPTPVTATATSPTSVSLTWAWPAGALRVDQVSIERSIDAGVTWSTVAVGLSSDILSFVDAVGVTPGTAYRYRLKVTWQQISVYSAVALTTTPAARAGNLPPESLASVPMSQVDAYTNTVWTGALVESVGYAASIGDYWFIGVDTTADADTNPDTIGIYKVDSNGVLQFQNSTFRPTSDSADYAQVFGLTVRTSGDRIFVGAPLARRTAGNAGTPQCGAVYEFQWTLNANGSFNTPVEKQRLTPTDGVSNDYFGYALATSGNRLIVGAPLRDTGGADSGRAYYYERASTSASWASSGSFDGAQAGENMGISVALNGRHFVLGAPGHDKVVSGATVGNSGAIMLGRWGEGIIMTLDNPSFGSSGVIAANLANSYYGQSVALDGGLRVLVGMPGATTYFPGGAAVWIGWDGGILDGTFSSTIFATSGLASGAQFGARVATFQGEALIASATHTYQIFQIINAPLATDTALLASFDPEDDPTSISILNDLWNAFELVSRSGRPYLKMKAGASLEMDTAKTITLRSRDDQGAVFDRSIWVRGAFENPVNDSDNDGMDNTWETANGLNPNYAGDANLDSDGDGLNNLAEYRRYVANSSGGGKNPASWDLDPDGDLDGDGVANKLDARPNDPTIGAFSIKIIEPESGALY